MSNPFRIGNQLVERVLLAGAYTDRCSSGCHRGQRSVFDVVTKYIDGICGPGRRLWQSGCHDALACGAPDSQRDNTWITRLCWLPHWSFAHGTLQVFVTNIRQLRSTVGSSHWISLGFLSKRRINESDLAGKRRGGGRRHAAAPSRWADYVRGRACGVGSDGRVRTCSVWIKISSTIVVGARSCRTSWLRT